jgi:hypothetical protein
MSFRTKALQCGSCSVHTRHRWQHFVSQCLSIQRAGALRTFGSYLATLEVAVLGPATGSIPGTSELAATTGLLSQTSSPGA